MTKTRARAVLATLVGITDGVELPPDCQLYAADVLLARAEERQPRQFNGANYFDVDNEDEDTNFIGENE